MDSAFAKLGRAQEHFAELQAAVHAHREQDLSDELSARVDYPSTDPGLANVTVSLKLDAPLRWSLIMGDILTNLRAALDHVVYEHADRRQQLNSARRKALKYPIFTERHDWDGTPDRQNPDGTIKKGSKGAYEELRTLIAPDVLRLIKASQPFEATNDPPEWHALAILSGLVNRDKHRMVAEVPINVGELAFQGIGVEVVTVTPPVETPDGLEVTATVRRPPRPEGAEPRDVLVNFAAVAGYIEEIDLPRVNARRSFLEVMEKLVKSVGDHLDELKAAGG